MLILTSRCLKKIINSLVVEEYPHFKEWDTYFKNLVRMYILLVNFPYYIALATIYPLVKICIQISHTAKVLTVDL